MKIAVFIKFGYLEYLEQLRKGILYMKPLSYFKSLEADEAKRSDSNEGLLSVYQKDQIKIVLKFQDEEHELKDLAGAVLITGAVEDTHAFCMFALTPATYEVEDEVYEGNLLKIRLDASFEKFGGYVLYTTNAVEFQKRVIDGLKRNAKRAQLGLVHYVDEDSFHGEIPEDKIGFYKLNKYKNQQEYRILVYGSGQPDEAIQIDVGDLSDITEIVRWDALDIKLKKNPE